MGFLSYHPDLDCLLITVDRDDSWIKLLEEEVDKFMEKFEKQKQKIKICIDLSGEYVSRLRERSGKSCQAAPRMSIQSALQQSRF